jgi:hypothetical protein
MSVWRVYLMPACSLLVLGGSSTWFRGREKERCICMIWKYGQTTMDIVPGDRTRGGGLTPLCINKIWVVCFFLIGVFLERCGGGRDKSDDR